jgi:hypothetical protein
MPPNLLTLSRTRPVHLMKLLGMLCDQKEKNFGRPDGAFQDNVRNCRRLSFWPTLNFDKLSCIVMIYLLVAARPIFAVESKEQGSRMVTRTRCRELYVLETYIRINRGA